MIALICGVVVVATALSSLSLPKVYSATAFAFVDQPLQKALFQKFHSNMTWTLLTQNT